MFCKYEFVYMPNRVCLYICACLQVCICMPIYVSVYVCICVCMLYEGPLRGGIDASDRVERQPPRSRVCPLQHPSCRRMFPGPRRVLRETFQSRLDTKSRPALIPSCTLSTTWLYRARLVQSGAEFPSFTPDNR